MAQADYNKDVVIDVIGRDMYEKYHAGFVDNQRKMPLTYPTLVLLLTLAGVVCAPMWARRIIEDAKL